MDKDEMEAVARALVPMALQSLVSIRDDPNARPRDREKARKELEARLAQLNQLAASSDIGPEVRRDIEEALRSFNRH